MAAPSGFLAGPGAAPGPAPDAEACTLSNDLGWALGVVFRGYVKATHEALAARIPRTAGPGASWPPRTAAPA